MISTNKPTAVVEYYLANGMENTLIYWNISEDTVKRYVREYNKINGIGNRSYNISTRLAKFSKPKTSEENVENQIIPKTPVDTQKEKVLKELANKYTVNELQAISKGYDPTINNSNKIKLNFNGSKIKIGVISDTHIGSKSFVEGWWDSAMAKFKEEKVDFICHVGDLVEGLSDRKGHWYECTHIGYDQQKTYAIELLNRTDIPIYGIDGNHDRWYIKSGGGVICKDVAEQVPHYHFLGSDEGDIYLNSNVFIKLWHGEDGSSYAVSYRAQKLIESFTGGEKPNLLLLGHVHKALYLPSERNVFTVSAGALCKQSAWMRSKKLSNHSGFWIVDVNYNETSVLSCKTEFFQLYSGKNDDFIIDLGK